MDIAKAGRQDRPRAVAWVDARDDDALWAALVNSDAPYQRSDRLDDDGWLLPFLARAGWDAGRPRPADLDSLRALRRLLRGMADGFARGRSPDRTSLAALNRHLAAAPSARRLAATGGGLAVVEVPIGRGFGASLGRVATSFAELLAVGEPTRLKVCANPECGWVMYDRSRNRSRRWCDATDCGNLLNVRHHRHRRRQANG